ncbi:MAG: acetate uptake transporter [Promethearchaeota archaeon]
MSEKAIKTKAAVKEDPPFAAEPASLGLFGLAVAALVLSSTDLGLASAAAKSLMIPWTVCLGATAQLIAGIIDFKRKNIFGGTVFTTFSLLWYSVSLTLFIAIFGGVPVDMTHYGFGLIGFLVFGLIMTVGSLMTNLTFLTVLIFIDLALGTLIPHVLFGTPAFIVGVFLVCVSASSFYGAAAVLVNTMAGKTVLPLGKKLWNPR